ncbi:protein of unknown function [Candidatus Methylomirabilis oxygeniifera]|uniref:Uncharacterized protein n=1 Tax=Methylomirabilis oxygeniifera TaxID=671143 RepID=D5MGV4_METO1|nr:protein of unknown function [Candidatus Methylomirabilis oxyfera]
MAHRSLTTGVSGRLAAMLQARSLQLGQQTLGSASLRYDADSVAPVVGGVITVSSSGVPMAATLKSI